MNQNATTAMPSIESTKFSEIKKTYIASDKRLRFGQYFHQQMKLEKMTSIKEVCDRIYNEPNTSKAITLIRNTFDFH